MTNHAISLTLPNKQRIKLEPIKVSTEGLVTPVKSKQVPSTHGSNPCCLESQAGCFNASQKIPPRISGPITTSKDR